MKTLAVFGDSWPAGAELKKEELPFGDILHEMLGTEKYFNMSKEGTAIDSLVIQLNEFIKLKDHNDCVCIFFLTNPTRQLYWNENKFSVLRPTGDKNQLTKFYFSHLQSDQLDVHKSNMTMLALQRMCQKHNFTDYYLEGWTKIDWIYSGIDKDKIIKQNAIEMLGAELNHKTTELYKYQNNEFIYPNKYHPNQKGHEIIAEKLYNYITL